MFIVSLPWFVATEVAREESARWGRHGSYIRRIFGITGRGVGGQVVEAAAKPVALRIFAQNLVSQAFELGRHRTDQAGVSSSATRSPSGLIRVN